MADEYKKIMHHFVGIGGIFCECCNKFVGKEKGKLNRLARRKFKENFSKELKKEIGNE
jgi:hypothetical protein